MKASLNFSSYSKIIPTVLRLTDRIAALLKAGRSVKLPKKCRHQIIRGCKMEMEKADLRREAGDS